MPGKKWEVLAGSPGHQAPAWSRGEHGLGYDRNMVTKCFSNTAQEAEETMWPFHPHAQVSGKFPSDKKLHRECSSSLENHCFRNFVGFDFFPSFLER